MVRKMAYIGFSYMFGLFFASFFYCKLALAAGAVYACLPILLWCLPIRKKYVTVFVCCICFGFGNIYYASYEILVYQNAVKYNGYTVEMIGTLEEYDYQASDMAVYVVNGLINGETKVKVQCYGADRSCEIGDVIYIKGKASVPKSSYAFDSEWYLKAKEIYLDMSYPDEIKVFYDNKLPVKWTLMHFRDSIYDKMDKYLSTDEKSIVKAMLFGDKSGIEDETKTLLYRAGIGHMMAVSGTHLSVICSIIWFLLSFLPINTYVRFICMIIPACIFVVLSGSSVSVIRSAIMIALVYGANLFNRRADWSNSLGISGILLTAGCPFVIRDASFLLSMAGVVGICGVAPAVIEFIEKKYMHIYFFGRSVVTSICASAVIFPVSCLFFDEVSVITPISNLILLPLCTVILVCGVFFTAVNGIAFIGYPIMKVCGLCCRLVKALSELLGGFELAYVPIGYDFVKWMIILSASVIISALAVIKNWKIVALTTAVSFSLCTVVVASYRFIPKNYVNMVLFCDGKGASSIVIHDHRDASVIDLHRGGNTAEYIDKYLTSVGIDRVEFFSSVCDTNVSIGYFRYRLSPYNVGTAVVPGEENDTCVDYAQNIITYETDGVNTFEMDDFTLNIEDNNTVLLKIKNTEILAYDGTKEPYYTGDYDIIIDYTRDSVSENLNGDIKISAKSPESEYFMGECTVFKIYDNKIRMEVR